jgi:hypothetical protein
MSSNVQAEKTPEYSKATSSCINAAENLVNAEKPERDRLGGPVLVPLVAFVHGYEPGTSVTGGEKGDIASFLTVWSRVAAGAGVFDLQFMGSVK